MAQPDPERFRAVTTLPRGCPPFCRKRAEALDYGEHRHNIHMDGQEMARSPTTSTNFAPRQGDTEKITINLGYVDLGRIDLLVQKDSIPIAPIFIRTAIRNQIERHADTDEAVRRARKSVELGLRHYQPGGSGSGPGRRSRFCISSVLGLASIAQDVTPELARADDRLGRGARSLPRQFGREGRLARPHPIAQAAGAGLRRYRPRRVSPGTPIPSCRRRSGPRVRSRMAGLLPATESSQP